MEVKPHRAVSPIDENHLLYGNYIGLQYAFTEGLDAEVLKRSILLLQAQFPALTGRYVSKRGCIMPSGLHTALTLKRHDGGLNEALKNGRPKHIHEPKRRDVLKGRAPLSTFTLTAFSDGGMILGVAISHLLTDAAGHHMILRHLSDIYTALKSGSLPPEYPFHSALSAFHFGLKRRKANTLKALKQRGLPKPIPIKGLVGSVITSLIIKAMDKSLRENPPTKIHLTRGEITKLKNTVLNESGEDWISTNAALCAHFTSLIAKLSYGDDIKTEMQIGQLLDLRGRYFKTDVKAQSQYVGNAILIHIDTASFPSGLQRTSRGELARYFKQRQVKTTPEDIKDRLDLLADCLSHGYTNPELDVKNPIISLNNQSKMPVYDVRFRAQKAARIFPQDVGDNIMFFPAPDGGIDIYIRDIVNPQRQQKLLTPEWQKQVFDF